MRSQSKHGWGSVFTHEPEVRFMLANWAVGGAGGCGGAGGGAGGAALHTVFFAAGGAGGNGTLPFTTTAEGGKWCTGAGG